ncbi:MAG: hypothetical protein ACHQAY_18930 [Hyphomicrobiales bacterium]
MASVSSRAIAFGLLALACASLPARAASPEETLSALYLARLSETFCGFTFDAAEKAKLDDAIAFTEGDLKLTPARKKGLDNRALAFARQRKAQGLCDPEGQFAKLIRQMIVDLPDP